MLKRMEHVEKERLQELNRPFETIAHVVAAVAVVAVTRSHPERGRKKKERSKLLLGDRFQKTTEKKKKNQTTRERKWI